MGERESGRERRCERVGETVWERETVCERERDGVRARQRESESESERKRDGEREREREREREGATDHAGEKKILKHTLTEEIETIRP